MTVPTSSSGKSYPVIKGYKLLQQIGGGGFSRVFRAINPSAPIHTTAAVKVVSYATPTSAASQRIHPPDRQALRKEVQIHQVLKHVHVLEFLTVEEILRESAGKDVPGLYMVLEYGAGGDLFDKIAPDVGVAEDLAHVYFTQLMGALEYIHSQGVAHRDIKPENLLLDAHGLLKLADFGLCSVYKYKGKERELKGACGSLPYIAPEMNGRPYKGEPADVWSTGVVLFALMVGNTPWDEPTKLSSEFMAYFQGKMYHPWNTIPPDVLDLIRGMLCVYPEKRFSIQRIMQHRWFNRQNPLLPKGQNPDPAALAEGLLQGLIVSGDLSYQLHTDGKRAKVPELPSLTQPANLGQSMAFDAERLPPSSAVAAIRTTDPRKIALSQQITARRHNVPSATMNGAGMAAGAASSQFTQAMNHMTQWSAIAVGIAQYSPHLTRAFCNTSVEIVLRAIVQVLDNLSVTCAVSRYGNADEQLLDDDDDTPPASVATAANGDSMDVDGDTSSLTSSYNYARSMNVAQNSTGAKIRVTTTDRRKCALRGEIRISAIPPKRIDRVSPDSNSEAEQGDDVAQTYVLMRRSKGDPLEWRRLFRSIVGNEDIAPLLVA